MNLQQNRNRYPCQLGVPIMWNMLYLLLGLLFVVRRVKIPPVSKIMAKRPRVLKGRHFIYETIENTDLTDPSDLHVVLTTFVEGIGDVGDVISVDPYYAREHLLLPRYAVYATAENVEKYSNLKSYNINNALQLCCNEIKSRVERPKFSSIHAAMMVKTLTKTVIPVFMNPKEPWTIDKKHIHIAFRIEGFHVPEDSIELPSTPIEGPDPAKESGDFAIYVTINNREKLPVRCRLFHIKPGMETAKLADELYLEKAEPILAEQKDLLESMHMPEILDDLSSTVSLVEKYRIQYIK
ncbi:39S ribosomal protein L9, mitochondrial [Caerostris extrusa]|uniref:Large ribosomal subunit protein bL9m n=1 Tax=Caerostris extrusa TaxID=172846 RepID=A0AAV4SZY8_CAEEX|nr:39S ribosomal protein L9, mitochondrial [Caerostris extrusa]